MTSRVAIPLADIGRQMRTSVHDDVALPPLALTHVVEHRDAAWCLHDPTEAPAERCAEFGQPAGQAALAQRSVLRTVLAVHARGVVAGRTFRASWRGRRVVCPAAAGRQLALARFSRLQQGETKLPIRGSNLPG